jgi:YebC/PmpR family DNA-binding regulatory protein
MSGHSKWATIKHKKAALDAKRGKAFTKLIKEITVAAKIGGDLTGNPRLRLLVDKARSINMPLDNITRAIKRGTGELPGVHYESHLYEGYGPYGIGIIVETLTDNKNRTIAELRQLFTRGGGAVAEDGAVSWMFKHMGVVRAKDNGLTEDKLLELLFDYEIDDIWKDENLFTVVCDPKAVTAVKETLQKQNFAVESAELEWVPTTMTELDSAQAEKAVEFLTSIEEHEDVQNVYSNLS